MPRQIARTRAAQIEADVAQAEAPRVIAIECRLLIHGRRSEHGDPCPCCGSTLAEIVESRHIDTLLLAPQRGTRQLRSETLDTLEFDAIVESPDVARWPMTLRCSDWVDQESGLSEADILLDRSTPTVIIGGANRSGKTHLAVQWLALRWLLRGGGGPVRPFRIYAPIIKQAHIGMTKLIDGERSQGPILPAGLVVSYPTTVRTPDQRIVLVDGDVIELMHARSAAHVKGEAVTDSIWLEATECDNDEVYPVAQARHVTTGGQMLLDSTPRRGHWMLDLVELAREEDRVEAQSRQRGDPVPKRLVRSIAKPISANPWNDPVWIAQQRAIVEAKDPVMARREFDGEWIGRHALMFGDAWDGEHNIVDLWTHDLSVLGLIDVTRKVSRGWWRSVGGSDWVVGVDVNCRPHTAVVCKIFEHQAHPGVHGLLVYDECRTYGDTYRAARHLGLEWRAEWGSEFYRGACVAIDANAAHKNQPTSHTGGRSFTPLQDYERLGFAVQPNKSPKGKPMNPDVRDSSSLLRHLMRTTVGPASAPIRRLLVNGAHASGTAKALASQLDRGDGKPVKEPGQVSDRDIAAYVDSLRYLAWPLFSRGIYGREIKVY